MSAKETETPPCEREAGKEAARGARQPTPTPTCSHPKEATEGAEGTIVRPNRATEVEAKAAAAASSSSKRENCGRPESESRGMMRRIENAPKPENS
jgi:hypothetical protein